MIRTTLLLIALAVIAPSATAQSVPLFEALVAGSPWELANRYANYPVRFRLSPEGRLEREVQREWREPEEATPEKVTWNSKDGHAISVWLAADGQVGISHAKHPSTFRSLK